MKKAPFLLIAGKGLRENRFSLCQTPSREGFLETDSRTIAVPSDLGHGENSSIWQVSWLFRPLIVFPPDDRAVTSRFRDFPALSRIGITVAGQLPISRRQPKPGGVRNSLFIPLLSEITTGHQTVYEKERLGTHQR